MKKISMFVFAALTFWGCQKDNAADNGGGGLKQDGTVVIRINVDKALTRAVEEEHTNATVAPKISSVTVVPYNEYGAELPRIDLSKDQIAEAVWGDYRDADGATGSQTSDPGVNKGAAVGIPASTAFVDVVINCPTPTYEGITNINYFNYRYNKDVNGEDYNLGDDNFDRVYLVTDNYGKGYKLETPTSAPNADYPSYAMSFSVKPALARFEICKAINVKAAADWIDYYNNHWSTMPVADYEQKLADDNLKTDSDASTGIYAATGDVKGTTDNGFDTGLVYIMEYSWFGGEGGLANMVPRDGTNTITDTTGGAGWLKNKYYDAAKIVTWYPNRFYAVDVEEVFINNIKVRSAEHTAYKHPWPGAGQAALYWAQWYAAYHTEGWHTAGTSATNTFLCMGNMWDRIATSDKTETISFPALNGVGTMPMLTGVAQPVAKKSEYYAGNHNLGILNGYASAFVFYPQSSNETSEDALKNVMPHIILKVKAYDTPEKYAKGEYSASKQFITVQLFANSSDATNRKFINNFEMGNIYRFDLTQLLYSFVGNVPVPGGKHPGDLIPTDPIDPDPEMPGKEVVANIQVLPWKLNNVFPVI